MKKLIIFILSIAMSFPVLAQNWRQADSLRKALAKNNRDTAQVNTLLRLCEFEIFKPGEFKNDLDSATAYLDQAKKISNGIQSADISGHIALTESYLAQERGQKAAGKTMVERAIQILSKGTDKYQLGQAYLSLARYYNLFSPNENRKAIDAFKGAAKTFEKTNYTERTAYAYLMLGEADSTTALTLLHLNRSLQLYQSIHYKELQGVYDAIGAAYLVAEDYKPALNYQLKALKAAQDARDTSMQLCEINNHIGITYFKLHEFENSAKYFKAALQTAEVYKDVPTIHQLVSNICNSELKLHHPQEVVDILLRTLNRFPTQQNDVTNDLNFTNDFVQAFTDLKQYNLAQRNSDHLLNLIAHNANTVAKVRLSDAYVALIAYFFASKQYSKELIYLKKNDTISRQLGLSTNIDLNNYNWFRLDTAQGNYKAAVSHLLNHEKIYDSTFTATKNKQVKQLQIQYETSEKENQINLLSQKAALQQSNLNQANLVKNVTFGGIALMLIIAGMLYRQSRLRKKNNEIITRQNELITHKNELLQNLVTEKEWLLKEVHHRVKNNLHTVICLLESQAAYLENDALKAIENSEHRIYAMSLIHQKLYQSEDIKTIDMSTYIPELVQSLEDSFGTSGQIKFKLKIDPVSLSLSHAIPLGLIINEAVTNSIKYAFPGNRKGEISISMIDHGKQIILELADNGIGMPQIEVGTESKSLGLELMKGLSKDIEADISFDVDNGTKITIIFEPDALNNPEQMKVGHLTSFQTAEMG